MYNTVTPPASIHITYDRKAKQYQWADPDSGRVLTAPAGKQNKTRLFQAALAVLEPDLFAAAQRWVQREPHLERTIWKAVEVVAGDGVETFLANGRLLAKVQSSDAFGRYSVTNHNGYIMCECPHWQEMYAPYDTNGQRVCKHVAAMRLYNIAREDRF